MFCFQDFPPSYNVSECNVPVALYYGGQDWLADPEDIKNTILPYLPNIVVQKYFDTWNHLDFVWGIHANDLLYGDIITQMKKKS